VRGVKEQFVKLNTFGIRTGKGGWCIVIKVNTEEGEFK